MLPGFDNFFFWMNDTGLWSERDLVPIHANNVLAVNPSDLLRILESQILLETRKNVSIVVAKMGGISYQAIPANFCLLLVFSHVIPSSKFYSSTVLHLHNFLN